MSTFMMNFISKEEHRRKLPEHSTGSVFLLGSLQGTRLPLLELAPFILPVLPERSSSPRAKGHETSPAKRQPLEVPLHMGRHLLSQISPALPRNLFSGPAEVLHLPLAHSCPLLTFYKAPLRKSGEPSERGLHALSKG